MDKCYRDSDYYTQYNQTTSDKYKISSQPTLKCKKYFLDFITLGNQAITFTVESCVG